MILTVSSSALSSHLQTISKVLLSKSTLPALEWFVFDVKDKKISVTASDGENILTTQVEAVEADSDGVFAIDAHNVLSALKDVSEQPLTISVDPDTSNVTITYQNGMYKMMAQNAEEYPEYPTMGGDLKQLEFNAAQLSNCLGGVLYAVANDDLRPVMNGVYLDIKADSVTFVASDGHKLVRQRVMDAHGDGDSNFILANKSASLLKNMLAKADEFVTLVYDGRFVVVNSSEYKLTSRLVEGRYPNYNAVIPQNNNLKVIVDRQQLISALRRVSVFSNPATMVVKLELAANQLTLSAENIDFSTSAKETMPCQYEGDALKIGFKATFLIDILNNIASDEAILELLDASHAGIILPSEQKENEDLLTILMPMMLND